MFRSDTLSFDFVFCFFHKACWFVRFGHMRVFQTGTAIWNKIVLDFKYATSSAMHSSARYRTSSQSSLFPELLFSRGSHIVPSLFLAPGSLCEIVLPSALLNRSMLGVAQLLNLALEKQAIGRVHRLGQARPVTVCSLAGCPSGDLLKHIRTTCT